MGTLPRLVRAQFACAPCGMCACGAPARTFHFTVAKIWPQYWARITNTILNLPQRRAFWLDTKKAASHGPIMNGCTENYWPRATRSRDSPLPTFTASACYAQKNPPYNAIAASLLNTLQSKSPTLRLCIYKLTILLLSYKKYVYNP